MGLDKVSAWNKDYSKGHFADTEPHEGVVSIVPELKCEHAHRILDLGCGAGRHVIYLAKKGFFVVGLDASTEALRISEERLRKKGIQNCCLVESNMIKLPFPDGHFDAVVSISTIFHNLLAGIKKTVSEIRRVTKPDGLVFVTISSTTDFSKSEFAKGKKLEKNTWARTSGKHPGVPHHFFDKKGARALFSGFKIIKMYEKKPKMTVQWYILARKQ